MEADRLISPNCKEMCENMRQMQWDQNSPPLISD